MPSEALADAQLSTRSSGVATAATAAKKLKQAPKGLGCVTSNSFAGLDVNDDSPKDQEAHSKVATSYEAASLAAKTTSIDSSLLELNVSINANEVQCMVDSGATHNFIGKSTVLRLGAKLQSADCLPVTLADGSLIEVSEVCELLVNFSPEY